MEMIVIILSRNEDLILRIIDRPIYNLRNINYGLLTWMSFWMLVLGAWIIPVQMHMTVLESIRFLFSFEFIEITNIQSETYYRTLNFLKVAVWIITVTASLIFLFKNPTTENCIPENEVNGI